MAGERDARIFSVAAWREAPYYSDEERAALALTDAATRLADRRGAVSDELWAEAVRLTPAGEGLARHGRALLERLATAEAELAAIAALENGRLRIGTYSSAGATLVVQAVADFRHAIPVSSSA